MEAAAATDESEEPSCQLSSLILRSLLQPPESSSSSSSTTSDQFSSQAIANTWIFCKGVILLTYLTSLLTGNYSQVDKLWSITPFVYAWLLVTTDARTLLMASLATLWGVRLTYNFNRRGGYHWPPWTGEEDYRWAYLQKGFYLKILQNRVVWHIFNFIFISVFQNILLLLLVTPSMVAHLVATRKEHQCFAGGSDGLNIIDGIATILFLAFLLLESVADNQQYAFQTEKYRRKRENKSLTGDYKAGYLQSGLYAWMRKPNYTGEQGIWVSYYLFSVASLWSTTNKTLLSVVFNCSSVGCILLMLLFQGSGHLTEQITLSKYPHYKEYQKRVPLYLPTPFSYGPSQKSKDP